MNIFTRVILFLFSLVSILFSGLTLLYFLDTWRTRNYVNDFLQTNNGFWTLVYSVTFLIVVSLIFLISSITVRKRTPFLKIATPTGTIEITKKTIESTALRSLQEFSGLRSPLVEALLNQKKENVSLIVHCKLINSEPVQSLAKTMQDKLKNDIESWLETPVKSIKIFFSETETNKSKRVV